jgi:hypothetical protein
LFIGNNLAAGNIRTSDGTAIDLRNIRSPIVVFCSQGDNITPPQQALGWILDLYENVDEIRAYGQTIVYTIHETIGHLGIFVSSGVARKEHGKFSSNIDLIDVLPPGLYEAKFERKGVDSINPDLASGEWIMRCEMRTLDDIRALGVNNMDDDRSFAAAERVSQMNLAIYRAFMQPIVRACSNPALADLVRRLHPLRLQYEMFSNANPMVAPVAGWAEQVRSRRRPAASDNPFIAMQENMSRQIVAGLDAWRVAAEDFSERVFGAIYGSKPFQAAMGINPANDQPLRRAPKSALHRELINKRIAELKSQMSSGGLREAIIRAMLFAGMGRAGVDERGFEALRRIREKYTDITLAEFKRIVREQFYMLLLDNEGALSAIPSMLPPEPETRQKAVDLIKDVLSAAGELSDEDRERLQRIDRLFGKEDRLTVVRNATVSARPPSSKAS